MSRSIGSKSWRGPNSQQVISSVLYRKEANEIVAMTVASIKTLRKRERGDQPLIQNPKSKIQN